MRIGIMVSEYSLYYLAAEQTTTKSPVIPQHHLSSQVWGRCWNWTKLSVDLAWPQFRAQRSETISTSLAALV